MIFYHFACCNCIIISSKKTIYGKIKQTAALHKTAVLLIVHAETGLNSSAIFLICSTVRSEISAISSYEYLFLKASSMLFEFFHHSVILP